MNSVQWLGGDDLRVLLRNYWLCNNIKLGRKEIIRVSPAVLINGRE